MKVLDTEVILDNPNSPLTLIPFGCVHRDDPGFREPLWRQCVDEIASTQNAYAIGLGDYANFLRTTARTYIKAYVADDNSFRELDSMVKGEAIKFYETYLKRIKDKLLGLAEGNHYHEFQNQCTDTQFLCDLAQVPYLDKPCFMRLTVKAKVGKELRTLKVFRVLIHHGDWSGGNSRSGGDINSMENKGLGFDFDIYLFGHTHRLAHSAPPFLTLPTTGELKVIERPRLFVRTGAFMAGYDERCQKSYAHKKLLPPTQLGYPVITIQFYRSYEAARFERNKNKGNHPCGLGNWKYRFSVKY
jgi:hypothetical protein